VPAHENERPPRGGLSENQSGALIRLRVQQRSSASCASRADPTRRGRWPRPLRNQWSDLDDDFPVKPSRRNWSPPMGTYLHSQRSRVHWASGKWGTVLPEYSRPNCASTASQASRPGKIRTPRNNPDLWAFLSARNERAICDGVLRIGALLSVAPDKCLQTLEFNLIVSPNAPSRALTLRWRRSLRNPIRCF
jgi:hypothetical protein